MVDTTQMDDPEVESCSEDQARRVWIDAVDEHPITCTASWQYGPMHREFTGTRDEVIRWAVSQPADAYWIFEGGTFVPLDPDTLQA